MELLLLGAVRLGMRLRIGSSDISSLLGSSRADCSVHDRKQWIFSSPRSSAHRLRFLRSASWSPPCGGRWSGPAGGSSLPH